MIKTACLRCGNGRRIRPKKLYSPNANQADMPSYLTPVHPNRAEEERFASFRVRGRRAHTTAYVTEPETRRKGARCTLILGLAEREGFAPLAQQLLYLAQPRLGIFVPSGCSLAALSRLGRQTAYYAVCCSTRSNPSRTIKKHGTPCFFIVAEREGFEPSELSPAHTISSRAR